MTKARTKGRTASAERPPRDDVVVHGARCPYCRDDVDSATDHRVCQGCLARHHGACWEESGRCAACSGTRALETARPVRSGDARRSRPVVAVAPRPASRPASASWRDLVSMLGSGVLSIIAVATIKAASPLLWGIETRPQVNISVLVVALGVLPILAAAITTIGRRLAWAMVPAVSVGIAAALAAGQDAPTFVAVLTLPMLLASLGAIGLRR
jgi:hypothetical protein